LRINGIIFLLTIYSSITFSNDVVNLPWAGRNDSSYDSYYKAILHLALEKSKGKYGEYTLNEIDAGVSQNHMIRLVQENKFVNLFWTMTSKKREELLLPVRFPLFKGLLGCRVFLIKKGQQLKFDRLENAEQLKSLSAGQGEDWPDTKILLSNHFKVTTSSKDENLFKMLAKNRFDYFPRALHEARREINQHESLAIEKRFLFYYDAPFYFFVNKRNKRLATRLEYGLKVAINDGSFEDLFNKHPVSSNILTQFNLNKREVISLENNQLTDKSKLILQRMGTRDNCLGKTSNL
jgi:hypothetical protein